MGAVYFVLMVGGLIFFHELGHYVVARMMGVHVVEFSIGFGPRLWSFKGKKTREDLEPTEYIIAALPIGGYVRMYGNDPSEESPTAATDVAYDHKPIWRRFLIMFAGPAFNLILPFIIFFIAGLATAQLDPSTVGTVDYGGPAWDAGIRSGDRITEIDGEEVDYFWQIVDKVEGRPGESLPIAFEHRGETIRTEIHVKREVDEVIPNVMTAERGKIGIGLAYVLPVIGVEPGSQAASLLSNWDAILTVDGQPAKYLHKVLDTIASRADREVALEVAAYDPDTIKDFDFSAAPRRRVILAPDTSDPSRGIHSAECIIHKVAQDTPAAQLGLAPGDRILSLDDEPCVSWLFAATYMDANKESVIRLTYSRAGVVNTVPLSHVRVKRPHELNPDATAMITGIETLFAMERPELVPNDHRLSFAMNRTIDQSLGTMVRTLAVIGGLFSGSVSVKEGLGGPVLIGQLAAKTSERGAAYFFNLMAFLSISLGLINLLPIPILDGGAIMFLAIEGIRRKPVSMRVRMMATYVGLAFIVILMVVVLRNDLNRCWSAGLLGL